MSTQTNKQNHIVQCLKLYSIQCFPTRFESREWCSSLQNALHCLCQNCANYFLVLSVLLLLPYSVDVYKISSFTANINIQVIVQVQLIKSSSVQLNVYEFYTAIDSQFSTKHSITNPPSMASKLEESVKPLAFSL